MKKIIIPLLIFTLNQLSAQSFDNYSNLNTIGIRLNLPVQDSEGDITIQFSYKKSGSSLWKDGFQMSVVRIQGEMQVLGTVFNTLPNTSYDIKVTLSDPTTAQLNGDFLDTVVTKKLQQFSSFTKTYYVSPSGAGNDFSLSAPGNIEEAVSLVQAGERILMLGGTYFTGGLDLVQSGTQDLPITIEGMPGENIILDGSEENVVWEEELPSHRYFTIVSNQNCNVVIADDIRLYPHMSLKELTQHNISWGISCIDAGVDGFFRTGINNTLRIKFRDNADPNQKNVKVGRYDYCFRLEDLQWTRFKNLSFKYYGSSNKGAVILKNARHIQFDDCKFGFNDIGIKVEENTVDLIVDQCDFWDGYGDWNSWRIKATYESEYLPGCTSADPNYVNWEGNRSLEKGGIFVSGNYSGRGIVVRDCTFDNIGQGMSLTPQHWWTESGNTSEIDFYNNLVSNSSEGMQVDVFPRNLRIWNNTFHHTSKSISTAPGADGPIYIFYNRFYDFIPDTNYVQAWGNFGYGRPLKINAGSVSDPAPDCGDVFFMHNTIYAKGQHYSMDLLKVGNSSWSNFVFLNNLWYAENTVCFRLRADNPGPIISDFNGFFNTNTNLFFIENGDGVFTFENLGSYHDQFGLEEHSIFGDPLFVDADNGNFTLSANSPYIDAGTPIPGLNDSGDFCPDIGAIESYDNCVLSTDSEPGRDDEILTLFPNPAKLNDRIQIKTALDLRNGRVEVYDMLGRMAGNYTLKENKSFSLNNSVSSSGVYLVRIISENRFYIKKVILEQ